MQSERGTQPNMLRAILTDIQFWIPLGVLAIGVVLLVFIHDR